MNDMAIWGKASWTEVIGAKFLRWEYVWYTPRALRRLVGWNGTNNGEIINLLYSFLPPGLPSLACFCKILGNQSDWLRLP